jgi:ech hydrogenase subunit A
MVLILIIFPLLISLILLAAKSDALRGPVVYVGAAVTAAASICFAVLFLGKDPTGLLEGGEASEIVGYVMMGVEALLALLIIYLGIKYKKYLASILAAVQCPLLLWFELSHGHDIEIEHNLMIDNFSVIMVLIIGIIGTLICVYATAYMKDFRHHHADIKDRSPFFFFLMFVFLSAMFGIVLSNNLVWMYFFWEITTLCSFLLIGYTKTPEAIKNSFRALIMNLLGGLAFVIAIVVLGYFQRTLELDTFLTQGVEAKMQIAAGGGSDAYGIMIIVTTLLCFAGITKAAQMPFNSWLLGAMVAPTPTSALLHSSTMVKAGVFLIVKLSPLLGVTSIIDIGPGFMVVMVGAITFLLASFAAVSQTNAKRVLAYSTIANLGLIIACAGLGSPEGVWAAIMLIIFHAVTKSLLFLSVGTAEHNIGSRDIEDMDGLFGKLPRLATFMMVGIAAMFLAPFGMLISKWAALQSFVDDGNVWAILLICFGSAVTLFYWGKWLGKLSGIVANRQNIQNAIHKTEWFVLGAHVVLVIAIALGFPLLSDKVIMPYLATSLQGSITAEQTIALSSDNMLIMVALVALIILLPLLFYGRTKKKIVPIYMAGVNEGDNLTFTGSMEQGVPVSLRNWYMEGIFKEKLMNRIGIIATCIIFAMSMTYVASVLVLFVKTFVGGGVA